MYTTLEGGVGGGGQPRRAPRQVYPVLREAILAGMLPPGTRLREEVLAEQYGVSRTPVREALRRLYTEGLVRLERNRGAVVTLLALDELDEVYDIRLALETLAAVRAASGMIPEDAASARAALAAARGAIERDDPEALANANDAFHHAIYRASHSPRLWAMISGLGAIIRRYRLASLSAPGRAEQVLREHAEVLMAIERGDVEAIRALMAGHLNGARSAALRMEIERARAARAREDAA